MIDLGLIILAEGPSWGKVRTLIGGFGCITDTSYFLFPFLSFHTVPKSV